MDSWSHTSWVVNDERLVQNFCQSVNEIPTRRKKIKRKPVANLFALHANANVMRIKKCYENFLMKNRSLSQISYFMFSITFSSPTIAHNQMALLQNFWKRGPTCLIVFQNWLLKLNLLNHIFAYDFLSDRLPFLSLDTDGKLFFTMKASFVLVFSPILIPVLDGDAFKVLQNLIDINLRLKKEIDICPSKHTCRRVWTIGLRTHDSFSVFRVF